MFRGPFGAFSYNWNGLLCRLLFLWDWRSKSHLVSVTHHILQRICTRTLLFYWRVSQRVSLGRGTKGKAFPWPQIAEEGMMRGIRGGSEGSPLHLGGGNFHEKRRHIINNIFKYLEYSLWKGKQKRLPKELTVGVQVCVQCMLYIRGVRDSGGCKQSSVRGEKQPQAGEGRAGHQHQGSSPSLRKKGDRALPCTGSSPSLSHSPLQQGSSGTLVFWELRCISYQDCFWKEAYKRQYACHALRSILGHLSEAQNNCIC